jgi:hypothetical protein
MASMMQQYSLVHSCVAAWTELEAADAGVDHQVCRGIAQYTRAAEKWMHKLIKAPVT